MGCCGKSSVHVNDEAYVERHCTDVFWLIIYTLFWVLMILIAAFSIVYGNPVRIVNGYDSFGNTCGVRKNVRIGHLALSGIDTSDRPYLLYYDFHQLRASLKICIKECPTRTLFNIQDLQEYYQKTGTTLCKYDFDYSHFRNGTIKDVTFFSGTLGPCPVLPIYKSFPVLNRCIPEKQPNFAIRLVYDVYDMLNSWDTLEQVLKDIYVTWTQILGLAFLSLVVSLIVICGLQLITSIVSYIIMILTGLFSIVGSAYLWFTYFEIKHNLDTIDRNMLLLDSVRNESVFLAYAIIATVITVIIILLLIVLRKQMSFLADLFAETAKCLLHLPALFFQPLLTFAILLLFYMFWIYVVVCLATSYYPGVSSINPSLNVDETLIKTSFNANDENLKERQNISIRDAVNKMTIVEYLDPIWVKYMWWVYLIGLIWTSEFIMACQQMVIAGAVAHWYYRHKYKDNDHMSYAFCKLIKYHLGSVALGSLVITLVKIPRLILMYLHQKLEWSVGRGNRFATYLLKCCICCFYCLEKCLRYLNHNAYTVIAIDGSGFCSAAATAFEVITSHALQVATINSLGDFILFLAKCLVTAVTGCTALFMFKRNADLTFYAVPTVLVCIFAFFIAHCVLSLYEMVLDTIYLCMCQSNDAPADLQMDKLGVRKQQSNSQET